MVNRKLIMFNAEQFLGMTERGDTEELEEFLGINPSTTPWCAAFINAVLKQSGIKGTNSNLARSFLEWGVPTDNPEQGDIAVFSRGNSTWQGHVAFVDRLEGQTVIVLGGNQGDKVCRMPYSLHNLLGFRTYE